MSTLEVSPTGGPSTTHIDDGRHDAVLAVAVVVVPGPGFTVTLTKQKGGPFAGRWLLPGGRIEVGETAERTALREVEEETGIRVTDLHPIGVYEIRGHWRDGKPFHVLSSAFLAQGTHDVVAGFCGDNGGGVTQTRIMASRAHSSDLRIMADAGLTDVPETIVRWRLRQDRLSMSRICGNDRIRERSSR